jgi:hypothetical protein
MMMFVLMLKIEDGNRATRWVGGVPPEKTRILFFLLLVEEIGQK